MASLPETISTALDAFEDAVFSASAKPSMAAFERLMQLLEARAKSQGGDGLFDTLPLARASATRIAATVAAMVTAPWFDMTPERFRRFCIYQRNIAAAFVVSGYGSTQSVRTTLARLRGQRVETPAQRRKRFALTLLADCDAATLAEAEQLPPDLLQPWLLGLLSYRVVMDSVSHAAREKLLEMGDRLGDKLLGDELLLPASSAWMHCSYAERADKHVLKGHLNALLCGGTRLPALVPSGRERPLIAVVAEQFRSHHAMFRCYGDAVRQLRGHAQLLLVAPHEAVDEKVISMFDAHLHFDAGVAPDRIATEVIAQRPDLVLFLSAGMSAWGVPLVNMRMAPVQLLVPGHPATSVSDAVDYLIATEDYATHPECYSERLLLLPGGIVDMNEPPGTVLPAVTPRAHPQPLRIAVSSATFKISWPFLQACAAIEQHVQRPVEWHFFPATIGLGLVHVAQCLQAVLRNVVVHPTLPYNDYLQRIAVCDVALGTFPFGGSNSNIDLLRLGIPKVWYTGSEMHSRSDRAIFGHLGLDSLCEAHDIEQFVALAVRMIDDDALRLTVAQHLREHPAAQEMMVDDARKRSDFADAILWVLRHHDEIVAADQRAVRVEAPAMSEAAV